jgi:hypothetical protein
MKTPDLRQKLERPDECIDWLGAELTKIGGRKTKAYKCWQEMLMYIAYCGKRMEKDNDTILRLKNDTILRSQEVVQQQHEDNKTRKGDGKHGAK